MELKHVVPKMKETFGKLIYAGEGEPETQGYGRTTKVTARNYNLYSSIQRADGITVTIVGNVSEHEFDYMDEVTLVNPRLIAEGKKAGAAGNVNGYTDYQLIADDIVKVNQ